MSINDQFKYPEDEDFSRRNLKHRNSLKSESEKKQLLKEAAESFKQKFSIDENLKELENTNSHPNEIENNPVPVRASFKQNSEVNNFLKQHDDSEIIAEGNDFWIGCVDKSKQKEKKLIYRIIQVYDNKFEVEKKKKVFFFWSLWDYKGRFLTKQSAENFIEDEIKKLKFEPKVVKEIYI